MYNPNAPSWLLDGDNPDGQTDPLLLQLEEERRRRQAAQQAQQPPPMVIPPPVVPTTLPAPTVDAESADLDRRNADADQQMAAAKAADAGITPQAPVEASSVQPTPSRQDTDGGLVRPSQTHPGVAQWDPIVLSASQTYGVPTNVIKAIMDIESGGDQSATSGAGAEGLLQVMPFNAQNGEDLYDPATNIMRGTQMLAERFSRYGTWEQAVASYFGAVDDQGNITHASDGNADGYGYVDAFRSKARAYAEQADDTHPMYGPSAPGAKPTEIADLRPSQFGDGALSMDEAYAACGPAAAVVFAAMTGRAPSLREAVDMARSIKAWNEGTGMYGPDAEVRLIQALGGTAKTAAGFDPNTVIQEVTNGNPVLVDTPGHYGVISGYDPASGRFYFGSSATDLKGGQAWMSADEFQQLNATGQIRSMILVDNPLGQGPSAATQRPGPSLPATWKPGDADAPKQTAGTTPAQTAIQQEMEHAQQIARAVTDRVQALQESARKQVTGLIHPSDRTPDQTAVQPFPQPPESAPAPDASFDLLKPQPVNGPPAPVVPQATDDFVRRAREIEQQFPDQRARQTDPAYQLAATRLAREWQESANPGTQVDNGGMGHPDVHPDGTPATPDEISHNAQLRLADQELALREQLLQHQIDARSEQAKTNTPFWQMTPDEYTSWRRAQGLEIRPDEYQRHAAAVLDAAAHGADIPAKVRDAYGVTDETAWQKDRMRAINPIAAVANGAPYDGADADFQWHSIDQMVPYLGALVKGFGQSAMLATLGMFKSGLTAADAGADAIARHTGLQASGAYQRGASTIQRYLDMHPELQSPDRPPEGLLEQLQYGTDVHRPDRIVRNAGQLLPYMLASGGVGGLATKALAATGLRGAAVGLGSELASSLAVTGLTSFGDFYDQAIHADPTQGQRPLSKDAAMLYAGLHALGQMGIEIGLGRAISKVGGVAMDRSPVLKKVSEILSGWQVAHVLGEGLKEGLQESAEEGLQQVAENAMAINSYDPGRSFWDGVGTAMATTFGPSAVHAGTTNHFSGNARAEAQAGVARYRTSLDEGRIEQMRHEVTDVASAETFARNQLAHTQAYGKSVGWDQQQIDLAQLRAAQEIYNFGLYRELGDRKLTDEQVRADPQLQRGILARNLAYQFEQRLAAPQFKAQNAARLQDVANGVERLARRDGVPVDGSDQSPLQRSNQFDRMGENQFDRMGENPYKENIAETREENIPPSPQRGANDLATLDEGAGIGSVAQTPGGPQDTARSEPPSPLPPAPAAPGSGSDVELERMLRQANQTRFAGPEMQADRLGRARTAIDSEASAAGLGFSGVGEDGESGALKRDRAVAQTERILPELSDRNVRALQAYEQGLPGRGAPSVRAAIRREMEIRGIAPDDAQGARTASETVSGSESPDLALKAPLALPTASGGPSGASEQVLAPTGTDGAVRAGAVPNIVTPRVTARVGPFEAPGRELGTYEERPKPDTHSEEALVWQDINPQGAVPLAGETDVFALGRDRTPQHLIDTVAHRPYAAAFVNAARAVLDGGNGAYRTSVQIIQSIADRLQPGEQPKATPHVSMVAVDTHDLAGWTDLSDGFGIAINPADIFHDAVIQVAREDAQRQRATTQRAALPAYTEAEQRQRIVAVMAARTVEVMLHETVHYWGDATESSDHGPKFQQLENPVLAILEARSINGKISGIKLNAIEQEHGFQPGEVRSILTAINGMIAEAERRLTAGMATTAAHGDQLAALNQDAREQRLLNLIPRNDNGTATTPGRDDGSGRGDLGAVGPGDLEQAPDHENQGSGVSPGEHATQSEDPGATGRADAVRPGAGDLSPGAESERAPGVGSAESVHGPAAGEPGPTADGRAAAGEPGSAAAPRRPASPLLSSKQLVTFKDLIEKTAVMLPVQQPKAEAERVALLQREWDRRGVRPDPAAIRWQMQQAGIAPNSREDNVLARVLRAWQPDEAVAPVAPVGYFTREALYRIGQDPRPGQPWSWSTIQRIFDPLKLSKEEAQEVLHHLINTGVLNARGQEVDLSKPQASTPTAPVNARATETAPVTATPSPEAPATATASESTPAAPETASTTRPTPQPVAQPGPTRPEAALTARQLGQRRSLDEALDDIKSDTFLDEHPRGSGPLAYGRGLREAVIVDGDPRATAQARTEVLDAIHDRLHDLELAREQARDANDFGAANLALHRRQALMNILKGFGREVVGYDITEAVPHPLPVEQPLSTATRTEPARSGRDGRTPREQVTFAVSVDKPLGVIVRTLGRQALDETLSPEVRTWANAMAEAAASSERTRFVDDKGEPITMSEWMKDWITFTYGADTNVTSEQVYADVEQMARQFQSQHPTIDVDLPKIMGIMLSALQTQTQVAFDAIKEARDKDIAGGAPIGEVGPAQTAALAEMRRLAEMSSLIPSVRKLATASGRVLRMMQMGEERLRGRQNVALLEGLTKSSTHLSGILERAISQIDAAIASGKPRENALLDQWRSFFGGGSSDGAFGRTGFGQVATEFARQNPGGVAGMFTSYADQIQSLGDVYRQYFGTTPEAVERNRGYLTARDMQELERLVAAEAEPGHVGTPRKVIDAWIHRIVDEGIPEYKRRTNARRINPETNNSWQADAKEDWRKRGENYARELTQQRLTTLEAWQVEALRKQIQQGVIPSMEGTERLARPGDIEYLKAMELHAHLVGKLKEIERWQAINDPQSDAYRKAHRNGLIRGGAPAAAVQDSRKERQDAQTALGEQYLEESSLDAEHHFVSEMLAHVRDGRRTGPDLAALTDEQRRQWQERLETRLTEIDDAREDAREALEAIHEKMVSALLPSLEEQIEKAETRRDRDEAKLDTDEKLQSALVEELGVQLFRKVDQEALKTALAGRQIGKVAELLRAATQAHFHEAYDERVEAEYWVSHLEDLEKQFGASTDPRVRDRLEEQRQVVGQKLNELERHPQFGEKMGAALAARVVRAIHGDAGSLVRSVQIALSAPGYRVNGNRHATINELHTIAHPDVLGRLAGTRAHDTPLDGTEPQTDLRGPLARALENRGDPQAQADLVTALNELQDAIPGHNGENSLGTAFKEAILDAVNIQHRKEAVLEMLPLVEANPSDRAVRYLVEMQLLDLRSKLDARETEPWFRQRFGSTEVALRRRYERSIERGIRALERESERAAEAANTYDMLARVGLATPADLTRAVEGRPQNRSASEILVQRLERQQAEGLRDQIRDFAERLWQSNDPTMRSFLETEMLTRLNALEQVGRSVDPTTGEVSGIGHEMAITVNDALAKKYFAEETRQGERQQGWVQKDEIKALVREIRQIHGYLLAGHPGDEDGSIQEALQRELESRLNDLAAVGATEPEETEPRLHETKEAFAARLKREGPLREMGVKAAEKLIRDLDLKTVRFHERESERRDRRKATEEVREIRAEAMTQVRALIKDPRDGAARERLDEALGRMSRVGYTIHEDVEVTDRDPVNDGITGKRTERRERKIELGQSQAERIREMVVVRSGSGLDDLQRMSERTDLTRDQETDLIATIRDRMRGLSRAARSADDLGRVRGQLSELKGMLDNLGARGTLAREDEQRKLQSIGFTRASFQADEASRKRMQQFFGMLGSGDPRAVAGALRLVTNPTWVSYYKELGLMSMLSSPSTWGPTGVNVIGQAMNAPIGLLRWAIRASIDTGLHLDGKDRTIFWSEAGAGAHALASWQLWKDAGKSFGQIWWYGHSAEQVRDANETGDLKGLRPETWVEGTGGAQNPVALARDLLSGRQKNPVAAGLSLLSILGQMSSLRILKATDELFGAVIYEATFRAQLERKAQQYGITPAAVMNRSELYNEVVEAAGHIKAAQLFQERKGGIGEINRRLGAARPNPDKQNFGYQLGDAVISTILPFTTVPYNSIRQSMTLSGIGGGIFAARGLYALSQGYGSRERALENLAQKKNQSAEVLAKVDPDSLKAEQIRERELVSDYLSKAVLGMTIQALAWHLAAIGIVSGDQPEDPNDRKIDETEQIPVRSIKIGSRWYSYDSTPLAVPLSIAANYFQQLPKRTAQAAVKDQGPAMGVAMAVGGGTLAAAAHNFFLENALQIMSQIDGSDRTANLEKFGYTVGSLLVTRHIPALLAYYARLGDGFQRGRDPFERDTRADGVPERLVNLGKSRLPGKRETLPARLGVDGQPVPNAQPAGLGLWMPRSSEGPKYQQLYRVLEKYEATNLAPSTSISVPGMPSSQFDIPISAQQQIQASLGKYLFPEVAKAYNSPNFTRQPSTPGLRQADEALYDYQKKAIAQAVQNARQRAEDDYLKSLGKTRDEQFAALNQLVQAGREKRAITPYTLPGSQAGR